jgi:diamine N-acetyltransferase
LLISPLSFSPATSPMVGRGVPAEPHLAIQHALEIPFNSIILQGMSTVEPPGRPPKILPAGPEHLPEIAVLAGVVWRAHYPGIITVEQIEYMLERMYNQEVLQNELQQGIRYDRILVDGIMRGFAGYGPVPGGEMKLHKIYIHPDWHRHGLGSLLLQHVLEVTRRDGFHVLILAVNKRNEKAIAAYQKNGFTIRESVVSDIGHGFVMDDYVMVKDVVR